MNTNKHKKSTVVFTRWTRKAHGVFQSLGKQLAIASMTLAFSQVFTVKTVEAQADTTRTFENVELDEIKVSAEEDPVTFSQTARVVTVITQKEIVSSSATTINELLEYALGTDLKQRGTHGVQADITTRGGTFDQTLILLNGINITDPQTGHHHLNLPINLESVKQIEILAGPAARRYGSNAFTGAVNIITQPDSTKHVDVHLSGGQYGLVQSTTAANFQHGSFRHFISFEHIQSDGYLQDKELNNTDFTNTNLYYHGLHRSTVGTFEFQTGYQTKAFGANSFYTPAYPEQFEATKTKYGALQYTFKNDRVSVKPSVFFRRHHDRFELFRDTAPAWYAAHNYHMTDVSGYNIQSTIDPGFGYVAISHRFRNEHLLSNNLGNNMNQPIGVPGENAEFTKQDNRNQSSAHFSYGFDYKRLHVATGVMASYYSSINSTKLYPGAEASYKIFNGFRVFGSYNQSLRLPTFTDLYYDGPSNKGNPDLQPEEATTTEAGLKYTKSFLIVQVAYYYRKGTNMIDWVKTTDDEEWQPQNLTKLNTQGIDFSCKFLPDQLWDKSPIELFRISYSSTNQNKQSSIYLSRYALDNLKHKASLMITHKIYGHLFANWSATWQDRNGSYQKFNPQSESVETPYDPFWLVDGRLWWQQNNWQFYIATTNLLNKSYFDLGNVHQPGRWIRLGIRVQFQ